MDKTWGDIFREFKESTGITEDLITDYRPCVYPYYDVTIPKAIILWLKNGSKVIYISKDD